MADAIEVDIRLTERVRWLVVVSPVLIKAESRKRTVIGAMGRNPNRGYMRGKTDYLDRIFVNSPCKVAWEDMAGTEQVRFCADCNKDVYDLSSMTRREAEFFVATNHGQICARLTRRRDRTVLTREEHENLNLISRRASPVAAVVVSAVIGVGSTAPALAGPAKAQAQASSISKGTVAQSSSRTEASFKPIQLEPSRSEGLDVPLLGTQTVTLGAIANRPNPLRLLYEKSDLILIGRAGISLPGSARGTLEVSTIYQVASVLKGKSRRKQISVIHYGHAEDFAEGKTALLFLIKGSAENGAPRGSYVLADFSTGIKALPQADIDRYAARISDLDAIERREHSSAEIVEWLVQCAEDPVTRWEGAYELATDSADSLDPESDEDRPACSTGQAGPVNHSDPTESKLAMPDSFHPEDGTKNLAQAETGYREFLSFFPDDPLGDSVMLRMAEIHVRQAIEVNRSTTQVTPATINLSSKTSTVARNPSDTDGEKDQTLVSRLTETQKDRLVSALLSTRTIRNWDLWLINVIKVWKEPRLVDFLMARLREMEDDPTDVADQLVHHLSDLVEACEVSALADEFRDLPSAEEARRENESDQTNHAQGGAGDTADQDARAREAAQKRSVALKAFLSVVERRTKAARAW